VEHIVRGTGDTSILSPTLPDQLEQIVDARQDVVHEDDRVEDLLLVLPQLVQRHQRRVSDLCEVLDSMVKRSPRPHRRPNLDSQAGRLGEGVKDSEEGFRLVGRSVLVDGDVDVVVSEDSGDSEEGGEEVWDDVKGVVEVDSEEVLVLLAGEASSGGRELVAVGGGEGGVVFVTVGEVGGAVGFGGTPREPAAGLAPARELLAEERGVALLGLLDVHRLGVTGALFGVVGGEGGEEFDDA
jgi:hypothetical protein